MEHTRNIVCNGIHDFTTLPNRDCLPLVVLVLADMSVELDVDSNVMSRELPRVEIKPVIRNLHLVSIDDLLLEDTILVPQSITPSRVIEGGHAVQETGCKTTKTSVTQGCITLLLDDVLEIEPNLLKSICAWSV